MHKGEAFTHRQTVDEVKGKKSQPDYIIGPVDRCDDDRISNDHKAWATWDHYPTNARIYEDDWAVPVKKMEEKLVWLEAQTGNTKEGTQEKIVGRRRRVSERPSGIQDQIEKAARKIAHLTKGERKQIIRHTPEDVKNREVAAARCKRVMERRVLSKQARRARANHLVKCTTQIRKKRRRRSRKELNILRREETGTVNRRDKQLQARAKLSNNKVSSLAHAIVSEMIKALPLEKVYVIAECFQQRFKGVG